MSDFSAWAIATVFAVWLAPWYIAVVLLAGLVVCFVGELP